MNLIVVFSRKYRWPEHYFSVWSLGNSQKLLTTNQFLVSTIFFTIMNISFFSLRFDLFSIIAKEINKIRSNVICVVARLAFLFYCVLPTGRCNAFQYIFLNFRKSEFYGPYISRICYFLWLYFYREKMAYSKLRFSKFKNFVFRLIFGTPQLTQTSLNFQSSCSDFRLEIWEQNCLWLFCFFHFERNYNVLKSNSPCFLLSKNINFNKNETE